MISTSDAHWSAGIMEGEGYFGMRRGGRDLTAELSMTDKDVIDRFIAVWNFGSRSERLLPSGKTSYGWSVTNQTKAAGFMMTLLPLMGERRRQKIIACLTAWKDKPRAMKHWTHCKNGHELAGDNLRILTEGRYTKRRCVECGRLRQEKYRAKTSDDAGIFQL